MSILLLLLAISADNPTPVLATAKDDQAYRTFLPKVENESIQKIIDDPRLILYTEKEIPRAHQDWEGLTQGIHTPWYDISANHDYRGFGNGNREFPWGTPAGTHRCKNVSSVRFLWLPLDSEGNRRPVVWFKDKENNDGYAWLFPVGTVVGEVLRMKGGDGYLYTFEMRIRRRAETKWLVDVFRPFPTSTDLLTAIKQLPAWNKNKQLVTLCANLESETPADLQTLASHHPKTVAFRSTAAVDPLPPLDSKIVAKLLNNAKNYGKFKSSLGVSWKDDSNSPAAPTSTTDFHIVPAKYDAGYIDVDSKSCMRCHASTNEPVSTFEDDRDWYGRIRGSDGIFSFHPFEKSCISPYGTPQPVVINKMMTDAGIIAAYDPAMHTTNDYNRIEGLK